MSLSAKKGRLSAVTKELAVDWAQTKEAWKDEKCREFEQKYLEELFASVDRAVLVIEQLDKLVLKIKKDCE